MDNPQEFEAVLATVTELLVAEGLSEVAELVRTAPVRADITGWDNWNGCLLYTSPSPRDLSTSRMPSSA